MEHNQNRGITPMGLNEIREKFLSFFESKEHLRLKSASLIPQNDKGLLLINSGMAPLKPYFSGHEAPPKTRVTTCQKCIRNTDIENVGRTIRHGSFFEMLGNFSFGDYFKEEIIPWSWEFITEVLKIPTDKLYVSVYTDDDEAYDIWTKKVGVDPGHMTRLADNFWEIGLGPCGPDSEIFYDRGEKYGCGSPDCAVGCDCDRFMEFWNLVFTQFNKNEDGSYGKLASTNIDTGMGLERISVIMQSVDSIFEVDTIKSILDKVCELTGTVYNSDPAKDVSVRIITDHVRSVAFLTADGVLPSNEGRGYILRRLLRRAARQGRLLGVTKPFIYKLCETAIAQSKNAYPELAEKADYIYKLVLVEEERFNDTLDQGLEILKSMITDLKSVNKEQLSGKDAFKLYDTFGFPLDLTEDILREQGFGIDADGFNEEMRKQREMARSARAENTYMGADVTVYSELTFEPTEFVGYDCLTSNGTILAMIKDNRLIDEAQAGDELEIITDKTPLYAESGGQKGDKGKIFTDKFMFEVNNCVKVSSNQYSHKGQILEGIAAVGDMVNLEVDSNSRGATARNHTATHLLQAALRSVLGTHIQQAGSSVSDDRLRFDFTHFTPITADELDHIESIINQRIMEGLHVDIAETDIEAARESGAMALFGEKYGKTVRVVNIGSGASVELCGGTHVANTSQIGLFKLLSESGVAAGVRRIEAITGETAAAYYKELEKILETAADTLKSTKDNLVAKAKALIDDNREMKSILEKQNAKQASGIVDSIIAKCEFINEISFINTRVDGLDMNSLKQLCDKIREKLPSCILVLWSAAEDKINIVSAVTKDLIAKGYNAGNIVRTAAAATGGNGGGKPNMAQAGGKDVNMIEKAMEMVRNEILSI